MKLCKDCKHHKNRECFAPQNMRVVDPVDGRKAATYYTCGAHRDDGIFWAIVLGTCGKGARWFEAATAGNGDPAK